MAWPKEYLRHSEASEKGWRRRRLLEHSKRELFVETVGAVFPLLDGIVKAKRVIVGLKRINRLQPKRLRWLQNGQRLTHSD